MLKHDAQLAQGVNIYLLNHSVINALGCLSANETFQKYLVISAKLIIQTIAMAQEIRIPEVVKDQQEHALVV